jgi:hypothetical protein
MPNLNTGKEATSGVLAGACPVGAGLVGAGWVGDGRAATGGLLVEELGLGWLELEVGLELPGGAVGREGLPPEVGGTAARVGGDGGNRRFQVAGPAMPSGGNPAAC